MHGIDYASISRNDDRTQEMHILQQRVSTRGSTPRFDFGKWRGFVPLFPPTIMASPVIVNRLQKNQLSELPTFRP